MPSGGRAVEVDGGYRLSGRWPFGSGCKHAAWLISRYGGVRGDTPKLERQRAARPPACWSSRAREATILDTWHVAGLNGSGSNDYTVTDIFVPAERSFGLTGRAGLPRGPLYLGRFFLLAHGAHALGIARAAVDTLTEHGPRQARRPGPAATLYVRDRPYIQLAVAQAEALVRGARAYLWETTRQVWEEACSTGTISAEKRALARLANSAAFESAVRAVDLAYTVGGGAAVYRKQPAPALLPRHPHGVAALGGGAGQLRADRARAAGANGTGPVDGPPATVRDDLPTLPGAAAHSSHRLGWPDPRRRASQPRFPRHQGCRGERRSPSLGPRRIAGIQCPWRLHSVARARWYGTFATITPGGTAARP